MRTVDLPIPLFLSTSGAVRVWKAAHAVWLREKRILGAFIGTSADSIQEPGLPFDLLPEQVSLLIEYGWAKLYHDPSGHPTDDQSRQFQHDFTQSIENYHSLRLIKSENIKNFKLKHPYDPIPQDLRASIPLPIETPTSADYYIWNRDWTQVNSWAWPCTSDDCIRYNVFKHLYEMGYYISRGSKFGGDYLLYRGLPEDYHSDYIVLIAPPNRKFSPKDIVAIARIGTVVNKTSVICSWINTRGFISICANWAGLG